MLATRVPLSRIELNGLSKSELIERLIQCQPLSYGNAITNSALNLIPSDIMRLYLQWLNIDELFNVAGVSRVFRTLADNLILDIRLPMLELDLSFKDENEYFEKDRSAVPDNQPHTYPDFSDLISKPYKIAGPMSRKLMYDMYCMSSHHNLHPTDPSQPFSIGVLLCDNAYTADYLWKHIVSKNGDLNRSLFRRRDWFRINLIFRLLRRIRRDAESNGDQFNFEWSLRFAVWRWDGNKAKRGVFELNYPNMCEENCSTAETLWMDYTIEDTDGLADVRWLGEGFLHKNGAGSVGKFVESKQDASYVYTDHVYPTLVFELSSYAIAQKYLRNQLEKVRYPREPGIRYPKGGNPEHSYDAFYVSLGDIFCHKA